MKISQYFPKPYQSFGGDINVKVYLSNYATKTDLKNATDYSAKIRDIKSKVPSITGLAKNSASTGVENEIPAVRSLVKRNKKKTRISETWCLIKILHLLSHLIIMLM